MILLAKNTPNFCHFAFLSTHPTSASEFVAFMPTKAHAAALVVGVLESAIVQYFVFSVDRERFNGDKEARAASQPYSGFPVYTA